MNEYTRRAIIVVKAADKDACNAVTKTIDTVGGEHTFMVPLVQKSNGQPPITHYICSWRCTQAEWDALAVEFGDNNGKRESRMFDGEIYTFDQVLNEMGLALEPSATVKG